MSDDENDKKRSYEEEEEEEDDVDAGAVPGDDDEDGFDDDDSDRPKKKKAKGPPKPKAETVSTPLIELLRGAVKAFGLKLSGVKLAGEPEDVVVQRLSKVLAKVGFDATDATQAKVDAFAKAIEDKKEKEAAEAALKRQKSLKLFDEPVVTADGSRPRRAASMNRKYTFEEEEGGDDGEEDEAPRKRKAKDDDDEDAGDDLGGDEEEDGGDDGDDDAAGEEDE